MARISWAALEVPPPAGPVPDATYAVDRLSRLTSSTDGAGTRTSAYDPVGNRVTRIAGSTTTYTYDRSDRMTAAGAMTVTVNAVGAMTARGADTFDYDQASRLIMATAARDPAPRTRALGFVFVGLAVVVASAAVMLLSRLEDRLPIIAALPAIGLMLIVAVILRLAASREFRRHRSHKSEWPTEQKVPAG